MGYMVVLLGFKQEQLDVTAVWDASLVGHQVASHRLPGI